MPSSRVPVLGPLRGVASLAVLWFHFTQGNPGFLSEGWLKSSGRYGWLGVEMFFVISGFVIPWSLFHEHYHRREHWKRFLAKRVIRLDPPYLVSIVLVLALNFALHGTRIGWPQLFVHLGYANAVLHYDWVNPVYWTLAIEAMFYLLVAAAFPYLASERWEPFVYVAVIGLPFLVPDDRWIFQYLPLFGMGIATFQFYVHQPRRPLHYLGLLMALTVAGQFAMAWSMALAGLGTALVIGTVPDWSAKPLTMLGALSYSLYLVHLPIGGKIINYGASHHHAPIAVLSAAGIATLSGAWALWRFVELPSQRLASGIRYGHTASAPHPLVLVDDAK